MPVRGAPVHELRRVRHAGGWAVRKALAPTARSRDDLARRLLWEGECLLRLGGRHHVLACHAVDPDAPALLLDWAPGGSLADRWRTGPVPGPHVALARALGDALAHVHAAGLVHRDVKPSNVLLAADGSPRLADFGVAAAAGTAGPLGDDWEEGPAGTLGYAAPEQLAGAPADTRADVYALGAVLHELATGAPAWTLAPGEDEAALRRRIVAGAPAPRAPHLPPPVDDVLARALAPEPGARWETVGALTAAWAAAWDVA